MSCYGNDFHTQEDRTLYTALITYQVYTTDLVVQWKLHIVHEFLEIQLFRLTPLKQYVASHSRSTVKKPFGAESGQTK